MKLRQERRDLASLSDFMSEDILSTPGIALIEEVAEDCGDPEFLASAFDRIASAILAGRHKSLPAPATAPTPQSTGGMLPRIRPSLRGRRLRKWST
jgi:hypothetical protein